MTLITWVLVLYISGHVAVAIPGYQTWKDCDASGRIAHFENPTSVLGHSCVSGPNK